MGKMTETIHRNEQDGVPYYTFPLFEKAGIVHGFSTKLGGVSKGDCATMNLSFQRGDDPDDVMENHKRFAKAVGYDYHNLVFSDQVHKTDIHIVTEKDRGKGILSDSDIREIDGLITQDKEAVLMTFFADCVPLFFYDPIHEAIGASHSGWRGTVSGMGARTVEAMGKAFGTRPEDLLAVIGPSICQSCYEVSEDVAEKFYQEISPDHWDEILIKKEILPGEQTPRYQLDLWRVNELILQEAGIPEDRIQTSGLCTCCHSDELFSHRATQGRRGNLAGVITLADPMK